LDAASVLPGDAGQMTFPSKVFAVKKQGAAIFGERNDRARRYAPVLFAVFFASGIGEGTIESPFILV
jgi:hypothetical protein